MTDTQTLTRAIELAIENGWEQNLVFVHGNVKDKATYVSNRIKDMMNDSLLDYHSYSEYENFICLYEIIYSHDFAKCLWGSNPITIKFDIRELQNLENWEWHLQNMAIANEPIEYLRAHMEDK